MRLDFYIAHATGLSRREARELIARGDIRVTDVARPRANLQLRAEQQVHWRDAPLTLPAARYLMLNKPAGFVSSTVDADGASVLQLVPVELRRDLHVVGRLDADTTGLLLLSSDGQWSHRITSPRSGCSKVYRVSLAQPISPAACQALSEGLTLKGEQRPTLPAQIEVLAERDIRLTIDEGRYHQVKRMIAAVGNHVQALHRERVGALTLDPGLAPGAFRHLTAAEVALF
jgi:16S rRNA pseudouridine516 synthase